jgi:hypothetical protein
MSNRSSEFRLSLPRPRSTVVLKEVSEGAILFCTETETYFSLNPAGVRIWRLLPPICETEDEVVARMQSAHPEIAANTLAADLRVLLDDLREHRLVDGLQHA